MKSKTKILLYFTFLLFLGSCSILSPEIKDNDSHLVESKSLIGDTIRAGNTIKVATWNLKFGAARANYYTDCHDNQVHFQNEFIYSNLHLVVDAIRLMDPDILLVQEIDYNSKRSAYVNEVEFILNSTAFNYAYYVPEWKENYVPVDGLGYIDSGNAIFTKTPIHNARFSKLPHNTPEDKTEALYYLEPNLCEVEIQISESQFLFVLNSRFSEFADHTIRAQQAQTLLARARELKDLGHQVIFGGCFYSLPPNTQNTTEFEDEICGDSKWNSTNYASTNLPMDDLYASFNSAIPKSNYAAQNSKYFTHSRSADVAWNRKTDYLFASQSFVANSDTTYQTGAPGFDAMQLSDHAPISVLFKTMPKAK